MRTRVGRPHRRAADARRRSDALRPLRRSPGARRAWSLVGLFLLAACGGPGDAPPVEVTVPAGAPFAAVVDTLETHGIVARPGAFSLYARMKGADREIRSGRYAFRPGERWSVLVRDLTEGRVLTVPVTIPEGFRLVDMVPRIAAVTAEDSTRVLAALTAAGAAERWDVPGPTLEGYLFPDTYRFAPGVPVHDVIAAMVGRYKAFWTPERRAALDSLGLNARELVTLASIIQAEARRVEEMPVISAVYHNRLRIGYLLQADPTVLYALGGRRERLLYAAIDSVADSPYNTYTQSGLPPGPIGAPGEAALEAALYPSGDDFLYFVARPDGSHIFTRSLQEHNRAREEVRRAWNRLRERPTSGAGGR